ncbi:MAG: hypothetical protein ACJ798_03470 [Phenylobacterium sp.]
MPTSRGRGPDYGSVRRFGLAQVLGAVLVLTLGMGMVTWNWVRGRSVDIATAREWTIDGPPCPALTETQWTAGHQQTPKAFDYDGITLARWSGDAFCSDVKTAGGAGFGTDRICQFTNPTALTVTSKAGTFRFLPGVGQPATVVIHEGVARCVLASKFTRETE